MPLLGHLSLSTKDACASQRKKLGSSIHCLLSKQLFEMRDRRFETNLQPRDDEIDVDPLRYRALAALFPSQTRETSSKARVSGASLCLGSLTTCALFLCCSETKGESTQSGTKANVARLLCAFQPPIDHQNSNYSAARPPRKDKKFPQVA
jgi:hypothetical protein